MSLIIFWQIRNVNMTDMLSRLKLELYTLITMRPTTLKLPTVNVNLTGSVSVSGETGRRRNVGSSVVELSSGAHPTSGVTWQGSRP